MTLDQVELYAYLAAEDDLDQAQRIGEHLAVSILPALLGKTVGG